MNEAILEDLVAIATTTADLSLVDPDHPWLGLDSFSEETRQFFFGREDEVAELARRVQRKALAILFGQSGLGKTSILRAGIVPRLRKEGFCPVYVRIDYSRDSPAPSQQIKQEIFRATEALGKWTRPGSAVPGESLWEFLHHRDDFLTDDRGATLIPLLIFDQFEEIFTLGQMDDFGRKRAEEFIADLADLVENRPPHAIELMLETEESVVERFDFNRADYRILIALREDYLAHLEGLKAQMPSITQNRMRLARMTGQQALAAVEKPGGKLVSEEVAESIVRFVAGGSELRNAEVEPSLLSLVCRELNNARIRQGRAEISADLLAGSRDTILNEFYERALADQPPGVRRFIEDEMLTDSGFRESLAEERVQKGFAAADAMANALPVLVNRRLLRIEERLDMRRVELTHDVLCAVVAESRNARHEREAKEEAERQLEAQRAREAATHRALIRVRKVAFGCAVLALVAVGGALFGYLNMKRAQDAEAKASSARALAESARGEAEKLIVYLLDDFYLELEPVGRLDIVADLSKRALAYYAALPSELRTPQTERNRALALVRYGYVLRYQAKLDEGGKVLSEAIDVLERLRREGDTSEIAAIGHALGLSARGRVFDSSGSISKALPFAEQAVEILRPRMAEASPSINLRRAYGNATNYLGFAQLRTGNSEIAVKTLELTRETYRGIDNLAVGDLASAAGYAEASAWQMDALEDLGRAEESRKVAEDAVRVASRVLEKRPGHMPALRSRALIESGLSRNYAFDMRTRMAVDMSEAAVRDWEALVSADPGNTVAWGNLLVSRSWLAWSLHSSGRTEAGLAVLRGAGDVEKRAGKAAGGHVYNMVSFQAGWRAAWEAEVGNRQQARAALAEYHHFTDKHFATLSKDSFQRSFNPSWGFRFEAMMADGEGEFVVMRDKAAAGIALLEALKTTNDGQSRAKNENLGPLHYHLATALYNLKEYARAEQAARESIRIHGLRGRSQQDAVDLATARTVLALALARQGRLNEARQAVEPALGFHRSLLARGSDDINQHVQLALSLYAAALASPAQAPGLVAEAKRMVDALPPEALRRKPVVRVREWIVAEGRKAA
jgi:tetratricopeptide (TPR) repeat protein